MYLKCRQLLAISLLLWFGAIQASEPESINLEITTHLGDAQTFVEGDEIRFMLSLDQAAYLYLFYQDAAHNLVQILPNREQPENHYLQGLFIPVPAPEAGFKFIVQAPFGEEKLWAFASDKPVALSTGKTLANGLILPALNIEQIRERIRQQTSQIFDQSVLTINTVKQKKN